MLIDADTRTCIEIIEYPKSELGETREQTNGNVIFTKFAHAQGLGVKFKPSIIRGKKSLNDRKQVCGISRTLKHYTTIIALTSP